MTTGHVFMLGLAAGMLLDQALLWLQNQCERYYRRRLARQELAEFWSER